MFTRKILNRILTSFMALLMILNLLSSGAINSHADDVSKSDYLSFVGRASQLILDNWDDDFFSSASLSVDSSIMTIDGEDIEITPPAIEDDVVFLPVMDIAKAIGVDVSIDSAGNMEMVQDGEIRKIPITSDQKLSSLRKNDFVISAISEKGEITEEKKDGSISVRMPLIKSEDTEEFLGLQAEMQGDTIVLIKPYQTKQLVVATKDRKKLKNLYGASQYVDDGNGVYLLQYDTFEETKAAHLSFESLPNIKYAVPNNIVHSNDMQIEPIQNTMDKGFLNNSFSLNGSITLDDRWGSERISADLFKNHLSGKNTDDTVIVAVTDTGVDGIHPFLSGRVIGGHDFVYNLSPVDRNGHGTHVSGTIVDCTPNNIKIMPVKVLDDYGYGNDFTVSYGIRYAVDNGAKIINMSLGGRCYVGKCLIEQAVDYAELKGASVVVAAGNSDADLMNYCPAKLNNVITVAATDKNDVRAYFSNYGAALDVSAPGIDILSCLPGNSYGYGSGTSMAAPHVSAAAAMLKLNDKDLTPKQMKNAIRNTAVNHGAPEWNKQYGMGVIDLAVFLGITIPISKVKFSQSVINTSVYPGFPFQIDLRVSVEPINATDKRFLIMVSDEDIVSYSEGKITIKNPGTATITVESSNGKTDICTVNVELRESINWIENAADQFEGGDGSKNNPFLIANAKQLSKLAYDVRIDGNTYYGKYFKMIADIDLDGKYWSPIYYRKIIGSMFYIYPFEGFFDGNNHAIKNMYVYSLNSDFFGLFGFLGRTTVQNLAVVDARCTSRQRGTGGILAGETDGTTINNCYTTGYIDDAGLIGTAKNSVISNCFTTASGLGAGLVFETENTLISKSYSTGEVRSSVKYGLKTYGGGLIHTQKEDSSRIVNSFSTVSLPLGSGFIESKQGGIIEDSYYLDENINGIKNDIDSSTTDITAKHFSFFQDINNFTDPSNWNSEYLWDFTSTWAIDPQENFGLPYLKNLPVPEEKLPGKTDTWIDYAAACYAGGTGTKDNPFLIETPEQLARVSRVFRFGGGEDRWFKLNANIDLSEHDWYPIGKDTDSFNSTYWFSGNFVGNKMNISNMTASDAFIIYYQNGSIDGINLLGINPGMGNWTAGGLLGTCLDARISNCHVSGTIDGVARSGGICGYAGNTDFLGCSANVNASGERNIGGLVGENHSGTIDRCSVSGNISSSSGEHGAIAGYNNGVIKNSYAKNISGSDNTGLVYNNDYGKIADCYFSGTDKYYIYDIFRGTGIGTEKTLEQMKETSTYLNWDFSEIWIMSPSENDGMPYFTDKPIPAAPVLPSTHWRDYAAAAYAGGSGSKPAPYLIATPEQLAKMIIDYCNGTVQPVYFKLLNDIDLEGHLWQSIGDNRDWYIPGFSAGYFDINLHFDGNHKTIKNMTQKNGSGFIYGLGNDFNSSAYIKDLGLTNIKGTTQTGLTSMNYGVIRNCYTTGSFKSVSTNGVAGLAMMNSGFIENSYSECNMTGTGFGGGLVGYNYNTVKNSYFSGSIVGNGLIVGYYPGDYVFVTNCYAAGELIGSGDGLCGKFITNSCINNSYYDNDLASNGTYPDNYSRTTEQMKQQSTYEGWDFESVWGISPSINNGYPHLLYNNSYPLVIIAKAGTIGGKVYGSTAADYNDSVTLTAVINTGYTFDGWYEGGTRVSTNTTYTLIATTDRTLEARFIPNQYIISATAGTGGSAAGGGAFNHGATVTLTATANAGYAFDGWYVNGTRVSANTIYTFAATSSRMLEARFALCKYTVIATATTGGSAVGGGAFNHGATVTLTATVNAGYTFDGWYEGGTRVSTNTTYTHTATADRTLEARFTPNQYIISATAGTGGSAAGGGAFNHGATVTLTATANAGYAFDGWYVNGTRVSANTIYTFAATSSRMLEARFALCKYTVIATATTGGSAVGGGAFNHGATVTLTATVNAGYTFNGWYEGGIRVSNNTTYTFTATASRTLEAWFRSFVPSNITSSTFTVANSFISNIPPNINISTFLSGLNERTYIKVFKGNAEIAGSARLGTGMSVRLMDGNTVKQSMTTVVKGDITGDGTTSALGLLKMKRDILGIEPLSGAFKQAADVNGDGKINALDLLMLKRDILGIEKLK